MENNYTNNNDCTHLTLCVCASCTGGGTVKYNGQWIKADRLTPVAQAFYSALIEQNQRYRDGKREQPAIEISHGMCRDCIISQLEKDFKDENPSRLSGIISKIKS